VEAAGEHRDRTRWGGTAAGTGPTMVLLVDTFILRANFSETSGTFPSGESVVGLHGLDSY
jgi:hypothetical protein